MLLFSPSASFCQAQVQEFPHQEWIAREASEQPGGVSVSLTSKKSLFVDRRQHLAMVWHQKNDMIRSRMGVAMATKAIPVSESLLRREAVDNALDRKSVV